MSSLEWVGLLFLYWYGLRITYVIIMIVVKATRDTLRYTLLEKGQSKWHLWYVYPHVLWCDLKRQFWTWWNGA